MLILGEPVDDDYEADDEAGGGIADALRKKPSKKNMESGGDSGILPDFDWTEDERDEIREALDATDARQRFVEEGEDDGRRGFDSQGNK